MNILLVIQQNAVKMSDVLGIGGAIIVVLLFRLLISALAANEQKREDIRNFKLIK